MLGVLLVKLVLVNLIKWRQRSLLLLLVRLTQHRVQLLRGRARPRQLLAADQGLLLVELSSAAKRCLLARVLPLSATVLLIFTVIVQATQRIVDLLSVTECRFLLQNYVICRTVAKDIVNLLSVRMC